MQQIFELILLIVIWLIPILLLIHLLCYYLEPTIKKGVKAALQEIIDENPDLFRKTPREEE